MKQSLNEIQQIQRLQQLAGLNEWKVGASPLFKVGETFSFGPHTLVVNSPIIKGIKNIYPKRTGLAPKATPVRTLFLDGPLEDVPYLDEPQRAWERSFLDDEDVVWSNNQVEEFEEKEKNGYFYNTHIKEDPSRITRVGFDGVYWMSEMYLALTIRSTDPRWKLFFPHID